MSSLRSSTRRARQLPWDVLLIVFQLSASSTLAVLGRVSLDFLVASSTLIYRDIEITSLKQLGQLFCERKEHKTSSTLSRINPHLSLRSIRTLLLDFTSDPSVHHLGELDEVPASSARLNFSRILLHMPIPVDSLRISYTWSSAAPLLHFLAPTLLPRLNPVRCEYEGSDGPEGAGIWRQVSNELDLPWSRLRYLSFHGLIFHRPQYSSGRTFFGALSPSVLTHVDTVRFEVNKSLDVLTVLTGPNSFQTLETMMEGSVVFEVGSDAIRIELEARIAALGERRKKFRVVPRH